jgi:hypothetical protein
MRIIGQKQNIYNTLLELYNSNYNQIKDLDYKSYASILIEKNPVCFDRTSGEQVMWMDENEVKELKDSLKNFHLTSTFNKAIKINVNEDEIKLSLKKDLIKILSALKTKNSEKHKNIERQVLFITYADYPKAWCYMYGEGEFPILKKPEYFDFDFSNELFLFGINIDYSIIWKDLTNLEELIDEYDLYNQLVNDSNLFDALIKSYVYKTYLLLFEVFEENEEELFKGHSLKKPFYIYGNEHDCEKTNIYIIE